MLSSDIKLSILNGAMGSAKETIDPPQVNCPSGNCTWPLIPTLGVCGACIDATPSLQLEETADRFCNLTSPLGLWIEGNCSANPNLFPAIFFSRSQPEEPFSYKQHVNTSSPNFIVDFAGLRTGYNQDGSRSFNNSQAAQCGLWYCLQTRNISVRSGELRDTLIDTYHDAEVTADVEISQPAFDGASKEFRFRNLPSELDAKDEVYVGLWWQMTAIQSYFVFLTESFIRGSKDNYMSIGFSNQTGGLFVEGFYLNFDRLDTWIKRLATSMSNEVRTTGYIGLASSNYTDAQQVEESEASIKAGYSGKVFVNQAIIVVRWQWIIYPAALVAFSVLFLAIQIALTADRQDVKAWKDNPLVPLCLQVDPMLRTALYDGLDRPNGMEDVAQRDVQISRDQKGLPIGFHLKMD